MKSYSEFITEQAQRVGTYTKLTRADDGLDLVMKHTNINDSASKGETPMIKDQNYPKETDQERFARTSLSSLQMTDAESKAVQKTPNRVALSDIEAAIKHIEYINTTVMPHLTICVVYLENGWAEVGHSAPADAENFDAELGKKFAKEAAIRKLWPLFGFALRDRLSRSGPPYTGEPRPFNPISREEEAAAALARLDERTKRQEKSAMQARQPVPEVDDNGNPTVQQGPAA